MKYLHWWRRLWSRSAFFERQTKNSAGNFSFRFLRYTYCLFSLKLADAEDVKHMDWFPSVFPRNVRCVISAVTGSRSAVLLSSEHRTPPPVPLHVGELNESAREEIVKRNLGKYNKVVLKIRSSVSPWKVTLTTVKTQF